MPRWVYSRSIRAYSVTPSAMLRHWLTHLQADGGAWQLDCSSVVGQWHWKEDLCSSLASCCQQSPRLTQHLGNTTRVADEELLQAGGCGLGLWLGSQFGTFLGLREELWAAGYLRRTWGLDLCDELGLGLQRLARRNGHILQLHHSCHGCWECLWTQGWAWGGSSSRWTIWQDCTFDFHQVRVEDRRNRVHSSSWSDLGGHRGRVTLTSLLHFQLHLQHLHQLLLLLQLPHQLFYLPLLLMEPSVLFLWDFERQWGLWP